MPLLKLIEVDANTRLGIWQIEESADDLKWALQWGQEDIKRFRSFTDQQRSLQWLTSRVLLRKMLNTDKYIDLQQDENGKPFLKNFEEKISISHSGLRVGVLLSNRNCGLDIQIMDRQMEKIAFKFISEEEKAFYQEHVTSMQIYVYWCAKEPMYKFYGRRKLDFRENLFIQPFEDKPSGIVRGRIEKDEYIKELYIYYLRMENYMLAYVMDKEKVQAPVQ